MPKKMNNLYIRADTTLAMGTGHIMRCIALAQAWKEKGGPVTFISHCMNETIVQRIESEGFNLVAIERPCPAPQDLEKTLAILEQRNSGKEKISDTPGWMVLDGYHFTADYQQSIQKSKIKLLVIDDYQHLNQYYANIILNQNIHGDRFQYGHQGDTISLLGLEYTLLRSEFLKVKTFEKRCPEKIKKILVTMGGSDPDNATFKVISALQRIKNFKFVIKVVVGSSNPHKERLKKLLTQTPYKIQLISNADMPSMMIWADLAITAGGSTCWELLYLKVPFMVVVLAENQKGSALFLEKKGVAKNCGSMQCMEPEILAEQICAVVKNRKLRDQFITKGSLLIDGLGAKRIIQQMERNND